MVAGKIIWGRDCRDLFGKSRHRGLEYAGTGNSWNGRTGPHPARYGFFQRRKSKCGLREGRPRPHADRRRLSVGREERASRLTLACSDPQCHKTRRKVSVNYGVSTRRRPAAASPGASHAPRTSVSGFHTRQHYGDPDPPNNSTDNAMTQSNDEPRFHGSGSGCRAPSPFHHKASGPPHLNSRRRASPRHAFRVPHRSPRFRTGQAATDGGATILNTKTQGELCAN